MIAKLVRHQQRRDRLRQARDMLGNVNERHRQVACRVQHGQAERARQHNVAGRRLTLLPQDDGPGQQSERQCDRHDGMKNAKLLEIEEAAPPRVHLAIDGRIEASAFAHEPANARTRGMLPITSTISPSTAAALLAKS